MSPPEPRPLASRRPWARDLQPAPGRTRVALRWCERAPTEGLAASPYVWDDLLAGDPPHHGPPAPAVYCVPGPELFEGGLRIELALLVSAVEAGPLVEDRLCVTGRALAGAIESERARMGGFVQEAAQRSRGLRERGVRKGRALRRRGGPVALLGLLLAWASRILHRLAAGLLRGARGLTRGVITFPDRVRMGWGRTSAFLATPAGRRRFLEGLKDPRNLSTHQKAVTLFTVLGSIVVAVVLVHAAFTLALPQHAVAWRRVLLLFAYSFVSSLGPPMPLEPVLFGAAFLVGREAALVTVLVSKVLAAYVVFFLGDEVSDRLRERAATRPWFARLLAWSESFASRYGGFAMAAFIATPGLPDVIALYVFGTLQMRLRTYLLGVLAGSFILNVFVLYGIGSLFGLG